MDNLMDLIFGIIYNDHDSDLIGRDQVDDYTIDTCLTADQGYETAVWVADHNMVIVARYATREEAVLVHREWINRCKSHPSSAYSVQFERDILFYYKEFIMMDKQYGIVYAIAETRLKSVVITW